MSADSSFYCMHSDMCKTLANPRRQEILDVLRDGELSVGDIVERTGISQANVSRHLAMMRARGMVASRREGARVHYAITNAKIIQAFDLISEVMKETAEAQNRTAGRRASGGTTRREPGPRTRRRD